MDNHLVLGVSKTFRGKRKKKNFSITKKPGKLLPSLTLSDLQKSLIFNLSKSPEIVLKDSKHKKVKDFHSYVKRLDNSMTKYQLTYVPPRGILKYEEKKGPNEKFMDIKDKKLIKKMYDFNKTIFNKGLASVNEDSNMKINIDQKEYPNPYQSLGVIKHNFHIFNEISKDFLFRQTDLFKEQIKNIQKHQSVLQTKMPNMHVSGSSNKENFDIPVVDLTEEKDKKEEATALPILTHTGGNLRLFSYYRYPNKNFPEGKEQFSMFLKDREIIICGGLSAFMKGMTIWSLNCEKLEWVKIPQKSPTNNRFGHTGVIYQNKIFLFGGRTKYGGAFVSPGLEIFSLTENAFTNQDPEGNIFPEPRKNHIAELIGNTMLIHGGLDEEEQILDDCYILNLLTLKWFIPVINSNTPHPKVYGHSSCLVVPNSVLTNGAFSVYKIPDVDYISKKGKKNIQKGLYIFGGKTKEINGLTNNLWILLLGQTPLQWIKPETKGIQPSPRYYHSMNFYEKSRYIIIHGGRNDNLSSSCALDDTFILELVNLNWIKIKLYSNNDNFKVISRFGHNSSIFDNKLIIFGGMNNNNYIGSSLFIVNLDFNFSPKIMNAAEQLMINNSKNSKIDEIKKQEMNDKLGIISQFILPPIK